MFLAINARCGDPRVGYAFIQYLVILLVAFSPAKRTWNAIVVRVTGFALLANSLPNRFAANRRLVRGHASRATWALFAITVPLSAGALPAWAHFAIPHLTTYGEMIPGAGLGIVVGAAIVFSQ